MAAAAGGSFLGGIANGAEKRPADGSGGSGSPEKKPRPAGGGGEEKGGNERKLVLRCCKTALAGLRKTDGENERAFGHGKGSHEQQVLKKSKDTHDRTKPKKGEHPCGAPRCMISAAVAEMSCTMYTSDKAEKELANVVFGVKVVDDIAAGLKRMLASNKVGDIREWDHFASYGLTGETRDGGQLLVLAVRKGRFISEFARSCGMLGVEAQSVFDLVLMPFRKYEKRGQAPKGSYERALEKLLKGLKIDDGE